MRQFFVLHSLLILFNTDRLEGPSDLEQALSSGHFALLDSRIVVVLGAFCMARILPLPTSARIRDQLGYPTMSGPSVLQLLAFEMILRHQDGQSSADWLNAGSLCSDS